MIAQTTPDPAALAPSILVADIGGTNTRVAMARGNVVQPDSIMRFTNAQFSGPEAVLTAYLDARTGPAPDAACVAIAGTIQAAAQGAVHNDVAHMTNLDWHLSETALRQVTGAARVRLLNDLQAQGHAVAHLPAASRMPILPGTAPPADGTRLVVGLGTGFNACAVHSLLQGVLVPAAEAGHAQLPLVGTREAALGQHLADQNGLVRVESLLSGPGLARAHDFFAGGGVRLGPAEVVRATGRDPAADAAMQTFVRVLGRLVADLALIHLPLGGIFLTGGVSRALAPFLGPLGFADSFHARGPFSDVLREFPVALVTDDYAALSGCARAVSRKTGPQT